MSDLYVGSASDIDITEDCGILDLLEPDDHVMADKGFEIQRLLVEETTSRLQDHDKTTTSFIKKYDSKWG